MSVMMIGGSAGTEISNLELPYRQIKSAACRLGSNRMAKGYVFCLATDGAQRAPLSVAQSLVLSIGLARKVGRESLLTAMKA